MGKIEDLPRIPEAGIETSDSSCHCSSAWLVGIRRAFTFRCLGVLILAAGVFLSAAFWLPLFRSEKYGFDSADGQAHAGEFHISVFMGFVFNAYLEMGICCFDVLFGFGDWFRLIWWNLLGMWCFAVFLSGFWAVWSLMFLGFCCCWDSVLCHMSKCESALEGKQVRAIQWIGGFICFIAALLIDYTLEVDVISNWDLIS